MRCGAKGNEFDEDGGDMGRAPGRCVRRQRILIVYGSADLTDRLHRSRDACPCRATTTTTTTGE